jgi:hypothetical protein
LSYESEQAARPVADCLFGGIDVMRTLSKALVIPSILVITLGILLVSWPCYLLMHMADRANAIWNENEAFILVHTFTAGMKEPFWKLAANNVFNPLGIGGDSRRFHEDLIVFHIRDNGIERYYLKDFGPGGWGYPFERSLYVYSGTNTMRFTGTNFLKINKAEVSRIEDQFPPEGPVKHSIDEQFKNEGWANEDYGWYSSRSREIHSIKLRNQTLLVTLINDEAYGQQRVLLEGRMGTNATETLFFNSDGHYHFVTKRTYEEAEK